MNEKLEQLTRLKDFVNQRLGGAILAGRHEPGEGDCGLECLAEFQGLSKTDDPLAVGCFDIRPLNDISVNAAVRTDCILPVLVAYQWSLEWEPEVQRRVVERLAILTIQRLLPELPGLPPELAEQCRNVASMGSAEVATDAVASWACDEWRASIIMSVVTAANRVSRIASQAYNVTADEAAIVAGLVAAAVGPNQAERIFRIACQLWLDAAADVHNYPETE